MGPHTKDLRERASTRTSSDLRPRLCDRIIVCDRSGSMGRYFSPMRTTVDKDVVLIISRFFCLPGVDVGSWTSLTFWCHDFRFSYSTFLYITN